MMQVLADWLWVVRLWVAGWLCPLRVPRTYEVEMLMAPGIIELEEV